MELLNGYILVNVDEETTQTKSGFLLAKNSVKLPMTGTVEATAQSVTLVKNGDRVQFLRYASLDATEPNSRLCTEDMIVAILE